MKPLETSYPPIANHGAIGSPQTAALVATDGTLDFSCYLPFDASTGLVSLVDDKRRGGSALALRGPHVTKQRFLPTTTVPVSGFLSPHGVPEVSCPPGPYEHIRGCLKDA